MKNTIVSRDPSVLGGALVFRSTRVPVRILMEHLEAGDSLQDFLDSYPTVSRSQAIKALELAKTLLTEEPHEAAAH